MLEISNLTIAFKEKEILNNISFSSNEDLVIIGSNGSGKSTLAKAVAGLLPNESIKINRDFLHNISREKRARLINYIPPKFTIFDEFISVYEFLELSILDVVTDNCHKDINRVIEVLNLQKLTHNFCQDLSSGESQLLLIASALLQNSQITIFDEPTTNLDPIKVKEVFNLLKSKEELQQRIVITHDLNLAKKLGFKILKLEDGKIDFFGSSKEFFNRDNLEKYYGEAIGIVDGFVVERL